MEQSHELLLKAQLLGRTGYVISDALADRVYWSESLFEIRKTPKRPYFTREEAIAFFHPDDRANFAKLRDAAIEARRSFTTEWRFNCGDGSQIWERGIVQPQYDTEGRYVSLLTVTLDITETKQNQVTLRDQEATYRTLFDGMGDAIILTNDGVFEDCNAAALEMFRCTSEQLIGKNPAFVSPEIQPDGRLSAESAAEKMAAALRGERQFFEWKHKRFDGTLFDAEVTINRVDIPGEKYFFGVIRDVTARKAADEALKAAHNKFASAFETSADAMIVARAGEGTAKAVVLDINQASERLFGKPRDLVIGKGLQESGFAISIDASRNIRNMLDTIGEFHSYRTTISSPGDGKMEAEISGSRFFLEGKPHTLLIVRDVTAAIGAEKKIHDLNTSLSASLKQLHDITDNLPVLVSHQNADGRFTFINKIGARWLGRPESNLIGKTIEDIGDADFIDMAQRMRAQRNEGKLNIEVIGRYPDGNIRAVDATYVPDIDENGTANGFYAVSVDITARKAAESALKSALEKFSGAFESSADAMIVATIGEKPGLGVVLEVNQSAVTLFRRPREELIGQTTDELYLIVDTPQTADARRALIERSTVRGLEILMHRADGTSFEAEISGSTFHVEGRLHALLIIRDISERIAAERRIHELNQSLNATVKQLRDIADNLPVLIAYRDAEQRFRFINKTGAKWLAHSEAELLGRTVEEIATPEYAAAIRPMHEMWARGITKNEMTFPYPDGIERAVDVVYVADRDNGGSLRGYYTLTVDITARKAAEEALKAAHDKFAGAFERSADAMIVGTLGPKFGSGNIVDANHAAEVIYGYGRSEMIGKSISELGIVPDAEILLDLRDRLLNEGMVRDLPIVLRRKDGSIRETEVSGSRFDMADGPHYLIITRDITERRQAERKINELNESLNASLKQLRDITDHLPVLISYQDAEGRFRFVNKTGEEWLARSENELLGQKATEILTEEYVADTAALREERARNRHTFSRELTVRFPDGKIRTAEGTYIRDIGADGVYRGTYTIGVDMTERRATEEQLRQSQKMQAIGKLTGGVAHDFNNLLAVILGNLEIAIERLQGVDDSVRELLSPALRAAERGATLTRSLLAFARQQPLDPTVIDVGGLVRDMTSLLKRTVPANIEIEFVSAGGLWKCEADAGQLQNALLNLVVNARDAMPDGGKLTIETGNVRLDDEYARNNQEVRPGQYVMIAVSDTGVGMAPDVIAQAFEPFFTTKGIGHGTGLGLSMIYGFAKQSNGHVAIYSEAGHGTTVRLYLPRWIGNDLRAERGRMQAPHASGETLLIVEDDEDVRFIAVTMLRSLGYTVLEAAGSKAALEMLAGDKTIRLLVSDVMLAGNMNGRRVAEEARKLNPDIKVLYMSGYTENAIVHHGRLDPGVQFIQKPFRKQDLALKVRQALDEDVS